MARKLPALEARNHTQPAEERHHKPRVGVVDDQRGFAGASRSCHGVIPARKWMTRPCGVGDEVPNPRERDRRIGHPVVEIRHQLALGDRGYGARIGDARGKAAVGAAEVGRSLACDFHKFRQARLLPYGDTGRAILLSAVKVQCGRDRAKALAHFRALPLDAVGAIVALRKSLATW